MICFQIVSLTYWKTTGTAETRTLWRLWFAFKLYLWRIEKQPVEINRHRIHGCDLLSNCIFDVLKNNCLRRLPVTGVVVICFQIVSLTYWKTTSPNTGLSVWQLWFAFKLYLWRIEKQQSLLVFVHFNRCDLLSNCIFDVLKNNSPSVFKELKQVVICFQIVSLTYWKTTITIGLFLHLLLWFAFKLYLWRIEKQRLRQMIRW